MADVSMPENKLKTVPFVGVYRILLTVAIGALLTWVFKLDDRIYDLGTTVATRDDILRIEGKIDRIRELTLDVK